MERDALRTIYHDFLCDFNSHAHVERDITGVKKAVGTYISTHTLTWSVTEGIPKALADLMNFNSHAHVERDSIDAVADADQRDFNSH